VPFLCECSAVNCTELIHLPLDAYQVVRKSAVAQPTYVSTLAADGRPVRVSDQVPPRMLVAALVTLLADALDHEETRHLANDRLRADLRGLGARVQAELEERSGRR